MEDKQIQKRITYSKIDRDSYVDSDTQVVRYNTDWVNDRVEYNTYKASKSIERTYIQNATERKILLTDGENT